MMVDVNGDNIDGIDDSMTIYDNDNVAKMMII